jgi:hypothetical protein
MEQADEVAQARGDKVARSWDVNPLMAEIVDALIALGGVAHREVVLRRVARKRAIKSVSEGFRRDIFETAAIHMRRAEEVQKPALIYLPFGAGSRRWALTEDFSEYMATAAAPPLLGHYPSHGLDA